jgi:hypothetical protein
MRKLTQKQSAAPEQSIYPVLSLLKLQEVILPKFVRVDSYSRSTRSQRLNRVLQ